MWECSNPAFFHLVADDVHGAARAGAPVAALCGQRLAHAPEFGRWDAQDAGTTPAWPICPDCLRRATRSGDAC